MPTVSGHPEANIHAFHTGLLVCAGVAMAAALAALTVCDSDAAATMIRPRSRAAADRGQPRDEQVNMPGGASGEIAD